MSCEFRTSYIPAEVQWNKRMSPVIQRTNRGFKYVPDNLNIIYPAVGPGGVPAMVKQLKNYLKTALISRSQSKKEPSRNNKQNSTTDRLKPRNISLAQK